MHRSGPGWEAGTGLGKPYFHLDPRDFCACPRTNLAYRIDDPNDLLWVFGRRICFTSIEISELSIHRLFVDFVQRKPGPWLGGWVGSGSMNNLDFG